MVQETKEQLGGLPGNELLDYEFATQEQIDNIEYSLQSDNVVDGSEMWEELTRELNELTTLMNLIQDEIQTRRERE